MTIREAVRELVKDVAINKYIRIGKATNIDKDKCLCDVDLGNDAILYNVKLKSVEGDKDKGLVIVPKEDTMVCAAMLEGIEANWTIVQHSEIESWQITTDSGAIVTVGDNGKVSLNGTNFYGLVKVEQLVERLNKIEEVHDKLVDEYNTHTHTETNAVTKPIDVPSMNKVGTKTSKGDIENEYVQHGDGA